MVFSNIRILHPSAKAWMKRGVKDFFAVYVGLGLTTAACLMFMYEWRNGVQITRYKSSYMVYRPNDPILKMYPKEYITDNELLPADHPTKLEDCDDLPRGKPIIANRTFRQLSYMCK